MFQVSIKGLKFSSFKITCKDSHNTWECNLAAVWGQMVTGGDHSQLEEQMSALEVPNNIKGKFYCYGEEHWRYVEAELT